MADWNKPTLTSTYTNVLTELAGKDTDSATMFKNAPTNPPTDAVKLDRSANKFTEWNGSAWVNTGFQTALDNHVADAAIHAVFPPGMIVPYAGTTAPAGWLLCDGAAVSRSTYAALFAICSTTYGAGNGSTTFNLPELRGRFPLGKAASGTGSTLGGSGGSLDHTHSVPAHKHGLGTLATVSGGSHWHTMDHDHAAFDTASGGAHAHTFNGSLGPISNPQGYLDIDTNDGSTLSSITIPSSGAHVHNIDVPAFTGITGTNGAHTHSMSGEVGNTGGVSGDASMTSGGGNPAFLALNYIIKI